MVVSGFLNHSLLFWSKNITDSVGNLLSFSLRSADISNFKATATVTSVFILLLQSEFFVGSLTFSLMGRQCIVHIFFISELKVYSIIFSMMFVSSWDRGFLFEFVQVVSNM